MSAWSNWILSKSSRFRRPDAPTVSSGSTKGADRVLHGRAAKATLTQVVSKTTKLARNKATAQKNRNLRTLATQTPVAQQPDFEHSEDTDEDTDEDDTDTEPDPDTAWRLEQIYLNTILNARNKFTLMPSTWRMHFRGIPLPDSLFYVKTKSKSIRPRIYARTDRLEYRGAMALRKLIDVHSRIQDIRDHEAATKDSEELNEDDKKGIIKNLSADIGKQLRRALDQALEWSRQDGGLDAYEDQLPSNVRIMELKSITTADEPESEVKIQNEMSILAEQWRTHAQNRDAVVEAPVIFGFVIMKHIITIVTLDASDPEARMHVPCQLHMAERNQHQWNALAILVTICWARDVVLDYIDAGSDLEPVVKVESSDPDA
ncbi:hypothetical protein O1611_g8970 [Lasiodiplodia mahajangana]|uniref:Uncharacterized protein n=1 Tax=Lasiodiplodia mahajangana TaxID=1108764 RepID=A0ACC2JAZ9_9PEZI|nr:hypothetical protein O1611_g8970 [Lasiodiplodia mahajangana]